MMTKRQIVVGSVLAGSVWVSGCADPCTDDGLLQEDNGNCPAATGAGTDSDSIGTTDGADATATETDPDSSGSASAEGSGTDTGTDTGPATDTGAEPSCDNEMQDGDETDVDCGGSCETKCDTGEGCGGATDCQSGVCGDDDTCEAPTCDDGVQNGDETDVDCGGGDCDACPPGGACEDAGDCESGVCEGGVCLPPACDDRVQNGGETDLDCGSECGATCEVGEMCLVFLDCVELVCGEDETCSAPTCTDGAPNGNETDVDCGGEDCPPCDEPGICTENSDCASGVCDEGICVPTDCNDNVQNGSETDVDCGGEECAPCDDGEECLLGTDCISEICDPIAMTCTPAACDDGIQNQGETDVDCGGPNCNTCPDGGGCEQDSDCESGVCDEAAGICEAATCGDGMLNGGETDVDCGGPDCAPCGTDEQCDDNDDCISGVCDNGMCLDPTCDDLVHNGLESDVDCGGGVCPACDDGEDCVLQADCISVVCLNEECQAANCNDGVLNGDETDVDCGGSCQACEDGEGCTDGGDCESGVCDPVTNTCTPPACDDLVQNGNETDVDCGGDVCGACDDGDDCVLASDCISLVCDPVTDTCTPASCIDGILNGDETDEDCGGACGATCEPGEDCLVAGDCISQGCDAVSLTCNELLSVVAAPACSESVGGPVLVSAVASGGSGGPYTYAWTPDDGTVANPNLASTNVTPAGFASYTVTADDGSNQAEDTVVVVNNTPFDLENNCTLFGADYVTAGPATVTYDQGGARACESGNNDFGLHLCTGVEFSETRLVGTVGITQATSDNDWVGLVWGAQDESNFYSLVWKQGQQNFFGCSTPAGIVVKRVEAPTLAAMNPEDVYCPADTPQSELLLGPAETTTAGWEATETYSIAIEYRATGSDITVTRDSDSFELASFSVTDTTFSSGYFGSTTLSQENACVGPLFAECL
ncbi:MAG: hypothetical protein JKY37_04390 [Nannocystaceae bacterium]|nr:hypothetical protein [Nannocystaceae bacterium]